ncbi:hypothetical protein AALP_AA8G157700 [Arabis alpina]|uniref:Pentacotripeptide-repeat region of PRORP domain-containing protein n=1 Tax=Arabis alpina TaxID=50452 RepID=A0A087G7B8_ARAAL|nr:hypothetical protein AALP_AA8G157700 [Arabis alpina]
MLNLLFITNSTRLRALNKVTHLSCRYSFAFFSSTSSLGNDSTTPRNYVASSLPHVGKLDRISLSLGETANETHGFKGSSLKHLLLELSHVVPNITRRFRRFPCLKPENVLELLLGFESEVQRSGIGSRKVRALWEVFRWSSGEYKGFKHLPQACEIIAVMLIREGMVKEVELLLMEMERNGDTLDNVGVFCDLIGKYVDGFDSRKAVMLFDWMRGKGLVPLTSCYQGLVDHLVRVHRTESAYRICLDWVEIADESNNVDVDKIGKVIELLCLDQRVHEARVLARKLVSLDCNLNSSIYSKIALGYCEKQDFEDLLSFIGEVKYEPDVFVGNRIVHSLCRRFGSERAYVYMEELERLGFKPDEATFGILIGWCCHEGDVRTAFLYLSEITSKGLKPDVYSYNAILSRLFRKGLWQHTRCILDEMKENGMLLSLPTFKIMVTGYCKARQFEEAKTIVNEMLGLGLMETSKVEDPLSEAFRLVGFGPLAVRLKRDNNSGSSKAEFFDDLGNGLYLDTDVEAYEQRVNMVLDRSVLPEFNLLIIRACKDSDLQRALGLLDEMARWGQKLSRQGFSVLLKSLCTSRSHVRISVSLLGKWPKLANQLDGETLNFLVQEYCKKGFSRQSKLIYHRMVQMHLPIDNATYSSLISCFCKKETINDLLNMWDASQNVNWLPDLNNCGALWECLLGKGLVEEAVKLFDRIFVSYPLSQSEACRIFVEKLTVLGFSRFAHSVINRHQGEGYIVEQEVYNHLITGLCKDKNVSAAFATLEEMLGKKYIPNLESCLMLIPRLCAANKTEKAFTLAEQSSVYNVLIEGLCLAGMMVDAENQLRLMLSNGVVPDNNIYDLMFQGYCKGNNLGKVEEVLGILVRKNVICSVTSYREYIRKMCSKRQFLSAISLKEILLLGESNSGSVIIYNLLIFYLFRAKNRLEVDKVLLEMQGSGLLPDETTYNFLVHGYSSCGDHSSSLQEVSAMISGGIKPNNRSLRAVIRSLCDSGDVKKALDIFQVMESKGWIFGSSVAQTKIVESLISKGEIPRAKDFLLRVTRNGMMAPNYDNLIKKLSDRGNLDIAVHLLNTMLKNRNIPDSRSYDSVISGLLRCSQLDKAMDFQTEMVELGLRPSISTWSGLVLKYCEACQVVKSERIIKSMVGLGETPSQEMFKTVIDRFRVENNTVEASEMMEMMQKCGYEIDFETHWSLISNMSSSKEKKTNGQGFLSRLLSGNGFAWKR